MDNKLIQTIQSAESRTVLQFANLLIAIVTIWFFVKLTPLINELSLLDQRVSAIEKSVNTNTIIIDSQRINTLEQQYNRLENKLDVLIQKDK